MPKIPCTWCKDGAMMGSTMLCLICDGAREAEEFLEPRDPATQDLVDKIEAHCREWCDYAKEKKGGER